MPTTRRAIAEVMAERKEVHAAMKALEDQLDELKSRKNDLDRELVEMLHEDEVTEYRSDAGLVRLHKRKTAAVKDWDAFEAWRTKQGLPAYTVMNKAVKADALHEMAIGGVPMPDGLELGEIEQMRFTPSRD